MRLMFLAFALSFLVPGNLATAGTPLPDGPHVVVSGEGKADIAPDSVEIALRVRHRSTSPAEAKRAVDAAVNGLLAVAPRFRIADKGLTASGLELGEEFDYDGNDRRVSLGHQASRQVKVTLEDPGQLSGFIDAALESGVTQVENIDFRSTQAASLRRLARDRAVADAREKAAGLATAFGGKLGPVYSINSQGSSLAQGYGATLDRITVTGSRAAQTGRYLQPKVDYTERVSAVFEVQRGK